MSKSSRKRRIILMCLSFFYHHGEQFVELVPHFKKENKQAWKVLRGKIKELHNELKIKFSSKNET
jgi:hypothetical protein